MRIIRQANGIWRKLVEQFPQCRVDRFFMRKPAQCCALASPRGSAAPRHIGGLVPAEHGFRRRKIADVEQAALQLGKLSLGRLASADWLGGWQLLPWRARPPPVLESCCYVWRGFPA